MKMKLASDNGNFGHDLFVDNVYFHQPNVYSKINNLQTDFKAFLMSDATTILEKVYDNLIITIESTALNGACNGTYAIGKMPIMNGLNLKELNVANGLKSTSPLPLINTLGVIAAAAVKRYFAENQVIPESSIPVEVELSTALPIKEHSSDAINKMKFWSSFADSKHTVQIYLGTKTVTVEVNFEKVAVMGEAQCAVHGIIWSVGEDATVSYRNDDIFDGYYRYTKTKQEDGSTKEEMVHPVEVTGAYFEDKRMLHTDVGSGTTEMPITDGVSPDTQFVNGYRLGVGQAVIGAMTAVGQHVKNEKIKRQEIEMYIRDENSYYHETAITHTMGNLEDEVEQILDNIRNELYRSRNKRVDVLTVYGGGSGLLRDLLFDEVLKVALEFEVDLLYVNKNHASKLNAQGLNSIVNRKFFDGVSKAFKKRSEEMLIS